MLAAFESSLVFIPSVMYSSCRSVSIVIPTWNGLELLQTFLRSVIVSATQYAEIPGREVEVLIVDDGSDDGSSEWLSSEFESHTIRDRLSFRVLRYEENYGFGHACNEGIREARFNLVFLLNNDVEPEPDCIARLVRHFDRDDVLAVHCKVIDFESDKVCGTGKIGRFYRGHINIHRSYIERGETNDCNFVSIFAGGGSAMFNRDLFLTLGGFDELFYPYYWEDVDISYRGWKAGLSVKYEPGAVVRHRISSTTSKIKRRTIARVNERNRIIFQLVNLHDADKIPLYFIWLFLLLISAPFSKRYAMVPAFLDVLRRFPHILKQRHIAKQSAYRSDEDVFRIFAALEKGANVLVYNSIDELVTALGETQPSATPATAVRNQGRI